MWAARGPSAPSALTCGVRRCCPHGQATASPLFPLRPCPSPACLTISPRNTGRTLGTPCAHLGASPRPAGCDAGPRTAACTRLPGPTLCAGGRCSLPAKARWHSWSDLRPRPPTPALLTASPPPRQSRPPLGSQERGLAPPRPSIRAGCRRRPPPGLWALLA